MIPDSFPTIPDAPKKNKKRLVFRLDTKRGKLDTVLDANGHAVIFDSLAKAFESMVSYCKTKDPSIQLYTAEAMDLVTHNTIISNALLNEGISKTSSPVLFNLLQVMDFEYFIPGISEPESMICAPKFAHSTGKAIKTILTGYKAGIADPSAIIDKLRNIIDKSIIRECFSCGEACMLPNEIKVPGSGEVIDLEDSLLDKKLACADCTVAIYSSIFSVVASEFPELNSFAFKLNAADKNNVAAAGNLVAEAINAFVAIRYAHLDKEFKSSAGSLPKVFTTAAVTTEKTIVKGLNKHEIAPWLN